MSCEDPNHSAWNRVRTACGCLPSNYWCRGRGLGHPKAFRLQQRPEQLLPFHPWSEQLSMGTLELLRHQWLIPQGTHAAAFLNSLNIHYTKPCLSLLFAACRSYQINAGHLRQALWAICTHLWLLLWSPPLSLQAFSQWGGTRVLQPLVAHLGTSQFPDNNPTAYFPME